MEDAVERQVRAYNARDVDEFVACYGEAVVIEDADGGVLMSGRDDMGQQYGRVFAAFHRLHAEILSRIRIGRYVIDEERVTGRPEGDVHAVAIYRRGDDGLIDRVRLLR